MKESCFELWTLCVSHTGKDIQTETVAGLKHHECHAQDSLDEGKLFQTLDIACVTYGIGYTSRNCFSLRTSGVLPTGQFI